MPFDCIEDSRAVGSQDDLSKCVEEETALEEVCDDCGDLVGVYMGTLLQTKPHGYGRMVYNNGIVYQGEWRNGIPHGCGECWFPNGDSYEGEYQWGKRNGHGTYRFQNGHLHEGTFLDDRFEEDENRQQPCRNPSNHAPIRVVGEIDNLYTTISENRYFDSSIPTYSDDDSRTDTEQ